MNITIAIQRTLQFVWEGALRLFSPSDDAYPVIGIQPFEGEPYANSTARHQTLL